MAPRSIGASSRPSRVPRSRSRGERAPEREHPGEGEPDPEDARARRPRRLDAEVDREVEDHQHQQREGDAAAEHLARTILGQQIAPDQRPQAVRKNGRPARCSCLGDQSATRSARVVRSGLSARRASAADMTRRSVPEARRPSAGRRHRPTIRPRSAETRPRRQPPDARRSWLARIDGLRAPARARAAQCVVRASVKTGLRPRPAAARAARGAAPGLALIRWTMPRDIAPTGPIGRARQFSRASAALDALVEAS